MALRCAPIHACQPHALPSVATECTHLFLILLNPDFYEPQLQKPHNKLKKAQIPLRENKLSLELKLGGGSTNPRSKGTPQPPLRRKSIRGAFSYLFSRAPLVFAGCPRVLSSRFLFTFSSSFFLYVFLISTLLPTSIRQTSTVVVRGLGLAFLCVCLSVCHLWLLCRLSHVCFFVFSRLISISHQSFGFSCRVIRVPSILFLHVCSRARELLFSMATGTTSATSAACGCGSLSGGSSDTRWMHSL